MKEIWKDIEGYENRYQVSNLGRVKSKERMVPYKSKYGKDYSRIQYGKIKDSFMKDNGYMAVNLYSKNKGVNHYIHRLVAKAFLNNDEDKETVNHKDSNRANNNVSNLEWATMKENVHHAINKGAYENKEYAKVKVVYSNGAERNYPSIVAASKNIGCHRDTIYGYWERGYSPKLDELNIKDIIRL